MKTAKCPICGNEIKPREDVTPFKNRMAHKRCLKGIIKASDKSDTKLKVETDMPITLAIPTTEAEYKEKKALLEYIKLLTGRKPTAKIYRLLEDYVKKYGFTFKGMLQGLQYYFEVLEQPIESDCVGILPYIYEEAQTYMSVYEQTVLANDKITYDKLNKLYPTAKIRLKQTDTAPELIDISKL